jgi:hypothetical protein
LRLAAPGLMFEVLGLTFDEAVSRQKVAAGDANFKLQTQNFKLFSPPYAKCQNHCTHLCLAA